MLTLIYSTDTFIKMTEGSDPTVSSSLIQDYYTADNELNLVTDTNFRLAFGWRAYNNANDRALKYDPSLMKWLARIVSLDKEGVQTYKDLATY